jgi:polygalacturonase
MDVFTMKRREFLALGLAVPAFGYDSFASNTKPPQFADREFSIVKFGAVEGGKKDSTEAIAKAIAACTAAGGGRVVVPEGVFLTGAIHLKSGVNLHVVKNATLLFNRDPKLYLPVVFTRWEGTECMNYSPFIYAFEQTAGFRAKGRSTEMPIAISGGTGPARAGAEKKASPRKLPRAMRWSRRPIKMCR